MALHGRVSGARIVGRGGRSDGQRVDRGVRALSGAGVSDSDTVAFDELTAAVPSLPRDEGGPGVHEPGEAQGGGGRLVEIIVAETVEAGPAGQDLAGDFRGDARIGQYPSRDLREARIEMREVARHADIVGAAEQIDYRADLALAALDRREAVALPVFVRGQL